MTLPDGQIGAYRIIREIGRGGMGVVYEAEPANPRRTVALKVIQPGQTSRQALRRFEHESQVLGLLQHPGIAQIFEAGVAEVPLPTAIGPTSGADCRHPTTARVPYFAMELMRGLPLLRYAEQNQIGTRERLQLIAGICDAVQHAHQKGVIHRDLKPSNVLVADAEMPTLCSQGSAVTPRNQSKTLDAIRLRQGQVGIRKPLTPADGVKGGSAIPKVLDFGVARVTDKDLQATTMHTDVAQLVGTVPYMSPEQASGDPQELDTRSDVYALGVMTYELLSGRLPHDLGGRSLAEAVRIIREDDATPLSSVDRLFRGDIDTIVGRALEKDKSRRYPSAADLAADIRRYLADEPILAHPPSALYQVRKFARRNRALVAASVTVMTALLAATIVSTWQARRARKAEQLASQRLDDTLTAQQGIERESAKASAVNQFLKDMLASVNPLALDGQHDVLVRDVLDRAARRVDEGNLADQPDVGLTLRLTLGDAYHGLGAHELAEQQFRAALELLEQVPEGADRNRITLLNRVAMMRNELDDDAGAEALYREVLALARQTDDPGVVTALNGLGAVLLELHRSEEADELLGEALPMLRARPDDGLGSVLNNLGALRVSQRRLDEAEAFYRESLDVTRRKHGDRRAATANLLNNLARLLYEQGDLPSAEAMFREALQIDHDVLGDEHPHVVTVLLNLGRVRQDQGDMKEAEENYRRALTVARKVLPTDHHVLGAVCHGLAYALMLRREYAEAEPLMREALDVRRKQLGEENDIVLGIASNLAYLLEWKGDPAAAETLYAHVLEVRRRVFGDDHPHTVFALHSLGSVYLTQQRYADAERLLLDALDRARRVLPDGDWNIGTFVWRYGVLLLKTDRLADAERVLLESHAIMQPALGDRNLRTRAVARSLAELYEKMDRPEDAQSWRARDRAE